MANEPGPRTLRQDDVVYRVLEPPFWDDAGIRADGFDDPHVGNPETLSLFVARFASPRDALLAIAKSKRGRDACDTGKKPPTAEQMYASRFRVAWLPAREILAAVQSSENRLAIERVQDGDFNERGHLGIFFGHQFSAHWARLAVMLSKKETLGS